MQYDRCRKIAVFQINKLKRQRKNKQSRQTGNKKVTETEKQCRSEKCRCHSEAQKRTIDDPPEEQFFHQRSRHTQGKKEFHPVSPPAPGDKFNRELPLDKTHIQQRQQFFPQKRCRHGRFFARRYKSREIRE